MGTVNSSSLGTPPVSDGGSIILHYKLQRESSKKKPRNFRNFSLNNLEEKNLMIFYDENSPKNPGNFRENYSLSILFSK
jgi:hypothetical protein